MRYRFLRTVFVGGTTLALAAVSNAASSNKDTLQPSRDLALINAVTWGVTTSSMAAYQAVGKEKWLQNQLHPMPSTKLPEAAQSQIDAPKGRPQVRLRTRNRTRRAGSDGKPNNRPRSKGGSAEGFPAGDDGHREAGGDPEHPAISICS